MIRYEFTDSSIREEDLHPDFIFNKEREMAQEFVASIKTFRRVQSCPVCGTLRDEVLFEKWGCVYAICPRTWTLSLATLPKGEVLQNYFFCSELSRFRASREYQQVVSERRKDLWESQIDWIEGRDMDYIATHYHMDLALAWSLRLEGKTDQEKFKELNWGLRTWDQWNFNECLPREIFTPPAQ